MTLFSSVSPKQPNISGFFELLEYLRSGDDVLDLIQTIYLKNIDLLKDSLRIDSKAPGFDEVSKHFNEMFLSKSYVKKEQCFKSFFLKSKILLIWLVSVYELLIKKNMDHFQNQDWINISSFIPKSDPFKIKYKWFSYINQKHCSKLWKADQDQLLKKILKKLHPSLFEAEKSHLKLKIGWSQVAFELCKETKQVSSFKSDKQCKEHWFNHLNPFLNKNSWSLDEDIKLMVQTLSHPLKWSVISHSFPGRTQHHIKNRFIAIVNQELQCKRKEIRDFIRKKSINGLIGKTLQCLNSKKQEVFLDTNSEIFSNNLEILNENTISQIQSSDEVKSSSFGEETTTSMHSYQEENYFFDVDAFINFD